jgi:hypothetical protein
VRAALIFVRSELGIDLETTNAPKILVDICDAVDPRDFGTTTSHAERHHFSLDFIFQ